MHRGVDQYQRALKDNRQYQEVWEPGLWLPRATMPMLWLTWLHDRVTTLETQTRYPDTDRAA